jgi:predicted nucleic acid-binding Zn ribbon protein
MIKKIENCIYCGEKMESITAKKKYCSAKCRLYFNRERKKAIIVAEPVVKSIKTQKAVASTKIHQAALETPENAIKIEKPKYNPFNNPRFKNKI